MAYETTWTVHFGDIDWLGILYYPTLFDQMAMAVEDMMIDHVIPFHRLIDTTGVGMPIVHAEADYLAPIELGDTVAIHVSPQVGDTSVRMDVSGTVDERVFDGTIVHGVVDIDTFESVPVPDDVADDLRAL